MIVWETVKEAIENQKAAAFKINDTLAKNPEVSGKEFQSAALICDVLEAAGLAVERELAGIPTAFRAAVSRVAQPQGKLALLCEYDALPEIGHACGHCASGSMSVLAGLGLHALASQLTMDIDIIGTPDEEATGGKVDLIKAGIFAGYDFAMMVHLDGVATRPNSRFLALDDFRVAYHGRPAHAAGEPWNGVNALNGVQLALQAIDMLRQQVRPETRIGYYILDGGKASNIIPDYALLECCVRHTERPYLNEVVARVKACFEGAAMATGTTCEISLYGNSFDSMKWNQTGTDLIGEVMEDLEIPHTKEPDTNIGSSDIGNVSFVCPAFHPTLRLEGADKVCHTKEFAAAMQAPTIYGTIVNGASILARAMVELMNRPERLVAIKAEFQG